MRKIFENDSAVYFEEVIDETPVRYMMEKSNLKVWIHADDILQTLGIDGPFEDFIKTDEGLDLINYWKKKHPGKPLGLILGKFEIPKK